MCSLIEVSVHYMDKIILALVIIVSQCSRADRLCIGDSVKRCSYGSFATEFREARSPLSAP